jgi:hypothetical protein
MYDPATMIPLAFEAIENMPGWDDLHRVRHKAMFLLAASHGNRPSGFAEYCPDVEDILLPPTTATHLWLPNGLPQFIVLGYRRWKGRKEKFAADAHIAYLKICQNTKNPDYCALFWFFQWLGVSGIKGGPIFPVIHKGCAVLPSKKVTVPFSFSQP